MKSGRTYEVFVDGNPVGLVGSTTNSLEWRRQKGYTKRFGQGVELRLIREVPRHESESDVDYNFHLKAAEALDIAKKKAYWEDGGLNKVSPLIQAIGHPMLEKEMGRIGGKIGGSLGARNQPREVKVNNGRKGDREGKARSGRNVPMEARVRGGRKGGLIGGQSNAKNHTGFCGRSLEKMRADGRKAGRIGFPIALCNRWNIKRGKSCTCGSHL